ncbi:protein of unknown function [Kingella kingae]|nr:protein of unknown function [Kingella kingae]
MIAVQAALNEKAACIFDKSIV